MEPLERPVTQNGKMPFPRLVRVVCVVILATGALTAGGCVTTRPAPVARCPVPSICPVGVREYTISRPFGGASGEHAGIDIPAPKGTPVAATADGQVIFAGRMKGYGRLIRIAHLNGIETWYAHLKDRKVKAGKCVRQGDLIGKVGNSGRSRGAHLHYEVRENGRPVDAARYLRP